MHKIKNISLFIITLLASFILIDIFIRTAHISEVSITKFYNDIGRGRRTNMNIVYFNEGFGIRWLNKYRYLGKATPPEKKVGQLRIALLGDSYVEALEVFDRQHFSVIAEKLISKSLGNKEVAILNFGRRGFDIADMYAYQKNFVEKFSPDYILYFLSSYDLKPNYTDPLRPKVKIENGELVISKNYSKKNLKTYNLSSLLIQNSTIFNMINNCIKKTDEVPFGQIILEKAYNIFRSPVSFKESEQKNNEFELNPITEKILLSLDTSKVIIVNRDINGLPDKFIPIIRKNNLKFLDLKNELNEAKEENHDPNYWKVTNKRGHWNHYGHKIVGSQLAKYITELFIKK